MVAHIKYKVGDTFKGTYGDFEVIERVSPKKIRVRFIQTGYEKICSARDIRLQSVKDIYFPNVHGVGCLGNTSASVNGKVKRLYTIWADMLKRCYCTDSKSYSSYGGKGVVVDEAWKVFEKFEKWGEAQLNFNNPNFQLDKDLINPNAKMYHPDNCSFVPSTINAILGVKENKVKTSPLGVSYHKRDRVFTSQCYDSRRGKLVHLGYHNTPEEAFQAYKTYKESLIKEVALEEYTKGNINQQVYLTLLNWEISPYPE